MAASDYVPIFFKNRLHLAGRPQMGSRSICPTGKSAEVVSSPFRKNISLRRLLETPLVIRPSRLALRGVSRSSRTLGAGCGGRGLRRKTSAAKADGEVVWS
jgi:hypothetical protein